MKITDKMRLRMGIEMIEKISANAESLNPERDWKESHDAVCNIYRIAHSIRAPECRKNHPSWVEVIDSAIRKERWTSKLRFK